MTNDIITIESAARTIISHLEEHLINKGILDAQFDPSTGILGLVDRIPDIEPSVNINLTISLSLISSASVISYDESIVLTAELLASYEGVSDVDLQTGEITGATIQFKNGNNVIGTAVTDSNGIATLIYSPVASECDTTLNLTAVFSGTDNFNPANSTVVNVDVESTLDLTGDKSILSYADHDDCLLTATLHTGIPTGHTVGLYDDNDTFIANMSDNGNGTYSYTYESEGVGDINFKAKTGDLVSTTYNIIDIYDYSDDLVLSYDTDHYVLNYGMVIFDRRTSKNFEYKMDVLYTTKPSSINSMISILDNVGFGGNRIDLGQQSSNYGVDEAVNSNWRNVNRPAGAIPLNTWYRFTIRVLDSQIYFEIYNIATETIFYSYTYNKSLSYSQYLLGYFTVYTATDVYIKNVSVEEL